MTQRCKGIGTDEFEGGSERVGTGSADPHGRWGLCADIMRASPLAAAGGTRLTLTAGGIVNLKRISRILPLYVAGVRLSECHKWWPFPSIFT